MSKNFKVASLAVLIGGLLLTGCENSAEMRRSELAFEQKPVRFIAHRGESYFAPENTVEAYNLAWNNGACWGAETDVYLTKDNVLVCNHDTTTDRTGGVPGRIRDMNYADLRKLDVGAWKGEIWRGTKMPTLREVFATVPKDKHIFVEIKSAGEGEFHNAYEHARLGSGIRDDQVSIISFSLDELAHVRRSLPHVRTLYLLAIRVDENGEYQPTAEKLLETLRQYDLTGADCFPDKLLESPENTAKVADYIKTIKNAGFEFHVWTFNSFEPAQKLYEMGVDSITTDCSGKLMTQFKEYYKNSEEK